MRLWQSALALATTIVSPPISQAGDNAWQNLPSGAGRAEVHGLCTPCHSLMIVKQQRLDRDSWTETLDWMVKQGMPALDVETRTLVLDYLSEHYGMNPLQNQ